MPAHAILLIQDVQLLCFTIVFGVLALQRWSDPVKRWLWYSFLANAAGAVLDLSAGHLPTWLGRGINGVMIPLSYAILNIAIVHFDRRGKRAAWISWLIVLAGLPLFLLWRNDLVRVPSDGLIDVLIAFECTITVVLLLDRKEQSTQAPRLLMGGFLLSFVLVELARGWVAFVLHLSPDVATPTLALVSAVSYIVNVSLLPLAFIWMMQARLEWDLLRQSIIDPLTGVLNRRGLEQVLDRELAHYHRYGEELSLAMLDLDHFKQLNDRYGHAAGDTILAGIPGLLTGQLRETDIVGRFGGEEFVLLFPHAEIAQVRPMLERLCQTLRQRTGLIFSTDVRITASLGVTSTAGRRPIKADQLLREADAALYEAKARGRDQVCYFQPAEPVAFVHDDTRSPTVSPAEACAVAAPPSCATRDASNRPLSPPAAPAQSCARPSPDVERLAPAYSSHSVRRAASRDR